MNNDKLKIALCISGQMRAYLDCFDSFYRYIINIYNPDIFIHTWEDAGRCENINEKCSTNIISADDLYELYNAKIVIVEKFDPQYFNEIDGIIIPSILNKLEQVHAKTFLPMFYKMKKCNDIRREYEKRNGIKYDFVIRIRPDLKLMSHIPKHVFENRDIFWTRSSDSFRVNDQYFIASSKVMNKFMGLWDNLEEYWKDPLGYCYNTTHKLGNRLFHFHLNNFGIEFKSFENRSYIIRNDFNKIDLVKGNIKYIAKRILCRIYLYDVFLKFKFYMRYRSKDKIIILGLESNNTEYLSYMINYLSRNRLSTADKYRYNFYKGDIDKYNISMQCFQFTDNNINYLRNNNIIFVILTKDIFNYIIDMRRKIILGKISDDTLVIPMDNFTELSVDNQIEHIIRKYVPEVLNSYANWYRHVVKGKSFIHIWIKYSELMENYCQVFSKINDLLGLGLNRSDLNKSDILSISLDDANVMKYKLERDNNYNFTASQLKSIYDLVEEYPDINFSYIGL
jgi:hypothetical protein